MTTDRRSYQVVGPIEIFWRESGISYWLCDIYDGPPRDDHHNFVDSTAGYPTEAEALDAGQALLARLTGGSNAS